MNATIHRSKVGTYHPEPAESVAWTINDTRGYLDGGPACDECGACDCVDCGNLKCECDDCIGLSFAYVCPDGGDALCEECAKKAGIEIVPCDCA